MKKLTLHCTHDDYHGLSVAVGNARDGSVHIKVDKAALGRLIADHGNLIARLKDTGELEGDV